MASGDGHVSVSLTVEAGHATAPLGPPGGTPSRLPTTGSVVALQLLALALVLVCIGRLLMEVSDPRRRARRTSAVTPRTLA